ncbi:hypothetical protein [Carp edema virus]|nr:hypothetical protein [Carp edema virus]
MTFEKKFIDSFLLTNHVTPTSDFFTYDIDLESFGHFFMNHENIKMLENSMINSPQRDLIKKYTRQLKPFLSKKPFVANNLLSACDTPAKIFAIIKLGHSGYVIENIFNEMFFNEMFKTDINIEKRGNIYYRSLDKNFTSKKVVFKFDNKMLGECCDAQKTFTIKKLTEATCTEKNFEFVKEFDYFAKAPEPEPDYPKLKNIWILFDSGKLDALSILMTACAREVSFTNKSSNLKILKDGLNVKIKDVIAVLSLCQQKLYYNFKILMEENYLVTYLRNYIVGKLSSKGLYSKDLFDGCTPFQIVFGIFRFRDPEPILEYSKIINEVVPLELFENCFKQKHTEFYRDYFGILNSDVLITNPDLKEEEEILTSYGSKYKFLESNFEEFYKFGPMVTFNFRYVKDPETKIIKFNEIVAKGKYKYILIGTEFVYQWTQYMSKIYFEIVDIETDKTVCILSNKSFFLNMSKYYIKVKFDQEILKLSCVGFLYEQNLLKRSGLEAKNEEVFTDVNAIQLCRYNQTAIDLRKTYNPHFPELFESEIFINFELSKAIFGQTPLNHSKVFFHLILKKSKSAQTMFLIQGDSVAEFDFTCWLPIIQKARLNMFCIMTENMKVGTDTTDTPMHFNKFYRDVIFYILSDAIFIGKLYNMGSMRLSQKRKKLTRLLGFELPYEYVNISNNETNCFKQWFCSFEFWIALLKLDYIAKFYDKGVFIKSERNAFYSAYTK